MLRTSAAWKPNAEPSAASSAESAATERGGWLLLQAGNMEKTVQAARGRRKQRVGGCAGGGKTDPGRTRTLCRSPAHAPLRLPAR